MGLIRDAGEARLTRTIRDAYPLNKITAQKNADGSVTIQYGGCGRTTASCLPITPGWNYWVRLYRPRAEILKGTWKFPAARPSKRICATIWCSAHNAAGR